MSEFDLNAELGLGNVLGNVNANVPAQAPVQPQNDFSELLSGTLFGGFKLKTTLPVGNHNVSLVEVKEGTSRSGSPKLDFIFKDSKGLIALETLSFGNFEQSLNTFARVRYTLQAIENKAIQMGEQQVTITQLIQLIEQKYQAVLAKANAESKIMLIQMDADILASKELSADDLASASNELERQGMIEQHKADWSELARNSMRAKYEDARAKGFQIYKPANTKDRAYAIVVDKTLMQNIYPLAKAIFSQAVGLRYNISLKQEKNYVNVKSITPAFA